MLRMSAAFWDFPPKLVVAVMPGGRRAITRAVGGGRSESERGAVFAGRKIARSSTYRGTFFFLAASGTTPYVVGA